MGQNLPPSRGNRGAGDDAEFGDPRLVNVELVPVPQEQRRLRFSDLAILWASLGVGPSTYACACGAISWREALAALALAALATSLLGVALSLTACRYGVGFVALCRAALGARGALLAVLLRWLVGVGLLAGWSADIGSWLSRLVPVMFPSVAILGEIWTQRGIAWLGAAALLFVGWWVARGGLSRIRFSSSGGLVLAVCVGFGLVVWAGIASRGFGPWIQRASSVTLGSVGRAVPLTLVPLLVGLVACADWERFRVFRGKGRADWQTRLAVLAPLALVPVAVAVAFVGVLLGSASDAVRGSLQGAPIPDAAGFGGIGASLGAALFGGLLWLIAAPLVGFYSSGLAASGLWPRKVGYLGGLNVTLGAGLVAVPIMGLLPAGNRVVEVLAAALAAVVGVLVVDELVVRRGRVLLEALFLVSRRYGPWLGVSGGAVVALVVGWSLRPDVLLWLMPRSAAEANAVGPLATVLGWGAPTLGVLGGGLVAAAVYVILGPLERFAVGQARKLVTGRAAGPAPTLMDGTSASGATNPVFVPTKKE